MRKHPGVWGKAPAGGRRAAPSGARRAGGPSGEEVRTDPYQTGAPAPPEK